MCARCVDAGRAQAGKAVRTAEFGTTAASAACHCSESWRVFWPILSTALDYLLEKQRFGARFDTLADSGCRLGQRRGARRAIPLPGACVPIRYTFIRPGAVRIRQGTRQSYAQPTLAQTARIVLCPGPGAAHMSEHHLTEVNDALDESKFVTFEGSPFQLYQPFPPAGDQPTAIDTLVEGRRGRPVVPDPARRDRLRQDLHDGQHDRAPRAAGDRVCAEQDARGAALLGVPRVLSAAMRSSISSRTTTITSRKRTCRSATCSSRKIRRSTSISSRCGCRRPRALMERRDVVIVATVSAIYGIGNPSEYHR